MIKVKYQGYDVELNNVAEVKELLGNNQTLFSGATMPLNDGGYRIPVRVEKRKYSKRKVTVRHKWTDLEMKSLREYHAVGATKGEVSRDSSLRARHTRGAVGQRYDALLAGRIQ